MESPGLRCFSVGGPGALGANKGGAGGEANFSDLYGSLGQHHSGDHQQQQQQQRGGTDPATNKVRSARDRPQSTSILLSVCGMRAGAK